MLDMDDNSNTNAQMFGGTYATYEVYFKEILAQCTTTLKKHGITGEMGKPIRQWYIPQTLIETRTEHDINQELELVSALKIMADKKLDPEIERFIKRERTIAADSAVLNYHRLVVTGKSYTGKTTWLHHLAITYCTGNISNQERGIVPILLSGQRLTEASSTSLWEVLQQWIAPYFSRTPGESLPLETILESGPCLLLLDDFEQLGTITQQEQVAKQILALAQRFPQLGILVTAYSDHCLKCLPGFHKLELRGFNDKQMRKFLRYHFAGAGTAIGIALAKVIEKNHHVHQVARNPQLLEILALVFAREGKLPTDRKSVV